MKELIPFSVGICAYNEVENIGRAVRSIYHQILNGFELKEVIVVSSGSTDGTDEVVRTMMDDHKTLRLIPQEKREGKNSALNCFLENKSAMIVVILNADTAFVDENCMQRLLEPLENEKVGIVGGHPIPVNDKNTVAGFASHLIWSMHHHVSLVQPKIGEIIAFRDTGIKLQKNAPSVDEDTIKMKLEKEGYASVYAPEAKIFNRGPETIRDYVKQRMRVNVGECYIKKDHDFDIPTWDMHALYPALIEAVKELGFHPIKLVSATAMEIYSRIKAFIYVKLDRGDMNIWEPIKTTKKL